MNYYILPKINATIDVNPNCSTNDCKPYVSTSLLNYYTQSKKQIIDFFLTDPNWINKSSFDVAIKMVNQYDFMFSTVPGYECSVSKLTPKTNTLYDLLEILYTLKISSKQRNIGLSAIKKIRDILKYTTIFPPKPLDQKQIYHQTKLQDIIAEILPKKLNSLNLRPYIQKIFIKINDTIINL